MSNLYSKPRILENQGQAMIISVIFFLSASLVFVIGVISPILEEIGRAENLITSKTTFFTAESGVEDMVYRLKNGISISTTEMISLNNATASTTLSNITDGKQVLAEGLASGMSRNAVITLKNGIGVAFFYGVQTGVGGVDLKNSSSINGSLFSNGPVTGSGNLITGDVVSAGPSGLIDNIHATGTARAHTISNSTIDKNAHYQILTGSTVSGTLYPGSPDPTVIDLPITDADIAAMEEAAANGTVITSPCPYNKTSGTVTLGPAVIECDLNLSNSAILMLTGPVWVKGDISISNNVVVGVSSSLGNQSVALIADDPSHRSTKGLITLGNSSNFQGSGSSNSYVTLISQNNSAELGGTVKAITMSNTTSAGQVLLYAGHGLIDISNTASLREVTAYKMKVSNSAVINYQTGLADMLFSSGPSGGYTIDGWKEGQ